MKVLHVTETYTPLGGIEQYILSAAALLEEHGHENHILYRKNHSDTIRDRRFPSTYLPAALEWTQQLGAIQSLVEQEQIDVVFVHSLDEPALLKELARTAHTVAYIHGFVPTCPALGKYFRRGDAACTQAYGPGCAAMIYLRRCSEARHPRTVLGLLSRTGQFLEAYRSLERVIVGSRYMQNLLIQNGFSARRIAILPPHFEEPHPAANAPDPRHILFVGRLEAEKGLPYLLKALAQIQASFRLTIAGDGSRRAEIEQLARQLDLTGKVTFTGWLGQDALRKQYEQAAFLIVPSIYPEPFGKVGIEAMANGRPVVAFAVGGIPDWLEDGVTGYAVPPRDTLALAGRIERLLADPALAARLGANGQKTVSECYSPRSYAAQLSILLQPGGGFPA